SSSVEIARIVSTSARKRAWHFTCSLPDNFFSSALCGRKTSCQILCLCQGGRSPASRLPTFGSPRGRANHEQIVHRSGEVLDHNVSVIYQHLASDLKESHNMWCLHA